MPPKCTPKIIRYFIICALLALASNARADLLLNWQLTGQTELNNIAISYKDENHILISAERGLKLLKLEDEVYLMKNFGGFKVAFRLSDFISANNQKYILKALPEKDMNFLPVMVINGAKQTVQGYEGRILLLKDYHKSVTIVSSHDEQHMAIKNALLPMLIQLTKKLPNLPNRQLIEILKLNEFGLPLRIDNDIVLTKSENIPGRDDDYSLKGYKVIGSLSKFIF
ncbi:MAG: hypothetical protein COC24_010605 [Alphaproteobacteria bacterium]|nr:hypothetical protein [Alphaproteobacteria bacterium]